MDSAQWPAQVNQSHGPMAQTSGLANENQIPLPGVGPGHNYSVVNIYGNGKAILGNVTGGLDPQFLGHANETDRKLLILRSLYYNGMRARGIQVSAKAGSPRSVDWVWSTNFATWLQTPDKFYWITGQPGSGKSSLMKHLSDSDKTMQYLRRSGEDWNILHFYFDFRAEDRTANRIEGMLRTFLHQFVKQVPSVAQNVDPETIVAIGYLTLHELLGLLADLLESSEAKICAFIDGLDEFRGSSHELLDVIHVLGDRASTNMKICLASRPEPIFVQQLGKYPSLAVQDFNDESIRFYTEMVWHSQRIDASAQVPVVLSDAIRHKARGNFLWARLAMDLAVQGLLAGNTIADLLEQVEQMPEGVQEMYKLTLQRLPTMLRVEAMLLLHLIVSAGGTLELRKLYTGLATAVRTTQLDVHILPVEHQVDNSSRIVSILGSFVDVSSLSNPSITSGTGISFAEVTPFRIRLGSEGLQHDMSVHTTPLVKLNHETLQAYFSTDPWLRNNLPTTFMRHFSDNFWLRAYADELKASTALNNNAVMQYGRVASRYILNTKEKLWYHDYKGPTSPEQDLITLLRYWPSWTPLLPYALDEFFSEVKAVCQSEQKLPACYIDATKSVAVIMHCALCHCQRLHSSSSAFFYGCLSGFNLHWKTGFVDPNCLETWAIYAAANHAIPEAVTWHLEHGQALAEYGSPRVQLLLTEILYKWCEKGSTTSTGYRRLLSLLVEKGARFDSRHLCTFICRKAQCTSAENVEICDLIIKNISPEMHQGHSHWCAGTGSFHEAWADINYRGDLTGKTTLTALLQVALCFEIDGISNSRNALLHHILNGPSYILVDGKRGSTSAIVNNKMLKVLAALKMGMDPTTVIEGMTAFAVTEQALSKFRKSYHSQLWKSKLESELVMIIKLLEHVQTHGGALPEDLRYYESFNCWTKEVRQGDFPETVLATGIEEVMLHGPEHGPRVGFLSSSAFTE